MPNRGKNGKKIHLHLVRMLIAGVLACVLAFPFFSAQAASNGTVRVKLTRLGSTSTIRLQVNCDYVLEGNEKMNVPVGSTLVLSASGGSLCADLDGVRLYCGASAKLLRCSGGNAGISFRSPSLSNVFCGDLYLYVSGSAITSVLHMDLENYLYGVVGYEMSNSWSLEALKAQTIAARNYALKKMNSRASYSYDLVDNANDQAFKGYNSSYGRVIQAVDATRGQALYAGSSLASCYYTASNGGQTEATQNVWGGKLSYSRVQDDPYDLESSSAKKKTALIARDGQNLHASLETALLQGASAALEAAGADLETAQITAIEAIEARDPKYASPSRLYKTLRFSLRLKACNAETGLMVYTSAQVDVPSYGGVETWYSLSLNSASNEVVTVEAGEQDFTITFRRWGHGVGMSQCGAQVMASKYGKDYRAILDFYYPGTTLKTLSLCSVDVHSSVSVNEAVIAESALLEDVPLRSAASEDATAIAELSAGVRVNVHEVADGWARISVLGLRGNVPVDVLDGVALPTATPEPTATATPEPTATAAPEPTTTVTPEPTATATPESTATATPEPSATVTPEPSATLTPEPSATATPEPTATATPEPTATVTPEPTATITPKPTATVTPEPTATFMPLVTDQPKVTATPLPTFAPQPTVLDRPMPTPAPAPDGAEGMLVATGTLYAEVNLPSGGRLNLRSQPSTASAVLGNLMNGQTLVLLAFDDDWACVRTSAGITGFVSRQYLLLPGETPRQPVAEDQPAQKEEESSSPQKFKEVDTDITICDIQARTRSAVKMYKSNSTSSKVIAQLDASDWVRVYAYNSKWAYVKHGSQKGYVQLKYLKAE